ncbi:hypothetical protein [Streptomyces sp. NPDC004726]
MTTIDVPTIPVCLEDMPLEVVRALRVCAESEINRRSCPAHLQGAAFSGYCTKDGTIPHDEHEVTGVARKPDSPFSAQAKAVITWRFPAPEPSTADAASDTTTPRSAP